MDRTPQTVQEFVAERFNRCVVVETSRLYRYDLARAFRIDAAAILYCAAVWLQWRVTAATANIIR